MTCRLRHRPGEPVLDGLVVEAELGAGAYGTVYRCRADDGTWRAVKEMHVAGDELAVANALAFFRREAACLARLDHPHVPHAYARDVEAPVGIDAAGYRAGKAAHAVLTITARHYLVMDYVAGMTLEQHLQRALADGTQVPLDLLWRWTGEIGQALAYLHREGLVHRDVKPQNILIREADQAAVLIDFGLCREACEPGGYGTVPLTGSGRFGTTGYAPPDPVEQESPVPASDQHALGMTIRRALTGLDPTTPAGYQVLSTRRLAELRPDLEPHLAAALDRAVRTAPDDRHASIDAFLAALSGPHATPRTGPQASWLELEPDSLDLGRVAPGHHRDVTLMIRDRRPGFVPSGEASSQDERLRILAPTQHGNDIALHLLLHVPRRSPPGEVRTQLVIEGHGNGERHVVPVAYCVDPEAPQTTGGAPLGCLLGALTWLVGRS